MTSALPTHAEYLFHLILSVLEPEHEVDDEAAIGTERPLLRRQPSEQVLLFGIRRSCSFIHPYGIEVIRSCPFAGASDPANNGIRQGSKGRIFNTKNGLITASVAPSLPHHPFCTSRIIMLVGSKENYES